MHIFIIIIPCFLISFILSWAIIQWKNFSGCNSLQTRLLTSDLNKTNVDIKLKIEENNQLLKTFDLFKKFENEALNCIN